MKRIAILGLVPLLWQPDSVYAANNAADGPRVLAPTSDWTLDFADERCSLIREFADGADRIRLQIDAYGPTLGYRVMLSGDLVAGSDAAPLREFRVGYSPDTDTRPAMAMFMGKFGNDNAVAFGPAFLPDRPFAEWMPRPPEQTPDAPQRRDWPGGAFQRSVRHMTVQFGDATPFRLDTGSMAAPLAAVQRCVDDLLTSWGIDPAQHRTRTRVPGLLELPDGYKLVHVDLDDDHPGYTERRYQAQARAEANLRERPQPRAGYAVPVRIMIDAAGKSTACVAQTATASEAYRRSTCETWEGPYRPALDAQGQPVASFVQVGL
jgi:hypothetical protein